MKRILIFMTERLQIEGKLQVNLIPAFSIVIHMEVKQMNCNKKQEGSLTLEVTPMDARIARSKSNAVVCFLD